MIENFSPNTKPLWMDTAIISKHPQQTGQVNVDVCIVGAGITGITAALLLKSAGKTVAVIDLDRVGRGETAHTTAHLTEVFDLSYADLLSNFGEEGAQLAAQSARRAIERIEENVHSLQIDCSFQRLSGYRYTELDSQIEFLESESEAATNAGVPNELVFESPLPFKIARAIRFDHQAQFNPLQYLAGIASRIPGDDSYIFEETRLLDIEEGEPCRVTTNRGTIIADDVLVAANVPSMNRFSLHTKIAAYRTYAIAARLSSKHGLNALFWDCDEPYHYIRSFNGAPHLIIGGEDHKTGHGRHTDEHFEKLEDWAHARFELDSVTHRWSGQIIEPVDGLPYIGRNPSSDHVFLATGYSGTGMTSGTIAAMLISDLIIGNQNPWMDLYDPSRINPLAGFGNFISENIDYPSHLIADRFTPARSMERFLLRENEGAIVKVGAKKVAAYRDSTGELHLLSPVCPHLGCYVHWNEAEKSWDCPCHGSRFNPEGKLLNGPAVSDLASETYEENPPMIPEPYESPARPTDPFSPPILSFFHCPISRKPS